MQTRFGWSRCVTEDPNARSLQNWTMQAHGAEMMQLATIAATEVGLHICCPIHDALLIEAPLDGFDGDVAALQTIMRAARTATIGLPVRTEAKPIKSPDRYMDDRGRDMWERILALLRQVEQRDLAA